MPVESIKASPIHYEVQVSGRLSPELAEWFGLALRVGTSPEGHPLSTLSGPVPDQAALFGILNRIRDLGMKLVSVNLVDPESPRDECA